MHVDNKGIIDVLWRGERKCLDPKGGDVNVWITNWEELNLLVSKESLVEVEHVKVHCTKKDKNEDARQRMGPKLRNCCKPVQVCTREHGKMLQRIQIVEDGRVPAKEAKNWRIEVKKRRITGKKYRRMSSEFELVGLMAQKVLWNLAREKIAGQRRFAQRRRLCDEEVQ